MYPSAGVNVLRSDGRRWQLEEFGMGDSVALEAVGITLPVDGIYTDGLGAILG